MRIAICDAYYLGATRALYARRPGLEQASYDEQHRAVMDMHLGTGDAYSAGLAAAGHEAVELVSNVDMVQAAWAREHGTARLARFGLQRTGGLPRRAARQVLLHQVIRRQLEAYGADVVYVQDISFFSRRELRGLRRPGRLLVGQLGVRPPADGRIAEFDLITTSLPHYVARLRAQGIATEYLAIAFDRRVVGQLAAEGIGVDPAGARDIPIAFVGGINGDVHQPATAALERLAEELDVQFWGYLSGELPRSSAIRARYHGEAWGIDMYRILARTRVALNRHSSVAEGMANNMRLFEATGVGACLLTEAAPNLAQLFAPGEEVAVYAGPDDVAGAARALLEDDERRVRIARAGQRRAHGEHTYTRRMAQLAEILERHAHAT
ncbi:MAG TPA: glycosyltransferase [Solirubrobacteraceae bacterium]